MCTLRIHPAGRVAIVAVAILLAACGSDPVGEPEPTTGYTLVLEAPGSLLSAAVLDLAGVDSVTVFDGALLTRRRGDILRVLALPRVPAVLTLVVSVPDGGGEPTGIVLEASDSANRPLGALSGAQLRVEP